MMIFVKSELILKLNIFFLLDVKKDLKQKVETQHKEGFFSIEQNSQS